MQKKQVSVCENHLTAFYEAIQTGDLALMGSLEHQLTESEKCVACAYLFKTKGTVREALEAYLSGEGFSINVEEKKEGENAYWRFWGKRLLIFSFILLTDWLLAGVIRFFILGGKEFSLFSFGIIELSLVGLISLVVFLFLDDLLFD
jgi:hypothetical protein